VTTVRGGKSFDMEMFSRLCRSAEAVATVAILAHKLLDLVKA